MKRLIVLLIVIPLIASLSGCMVTQASSKLKVGSISVELPKNIHAEKLVVIVNPITGTYTLTADVITSDASAVIDSAGAANAKAFSKMADAINTLAPVAKSAVIP